MNRAEARREAKAAKKSADAKLREASRRTTHARKEALEMLRQFRAECRGIDQSYIDPTVAFVPAEMLSRMYAEVPRHLSAREISAQNEQCLKRRYDEHDREDGGRDMRAGQ